MPDATLYEVDIAKVVSLLRHLHRGLARERNSALRGGPTAGSRKRKTGTNGLFNKRIRALSIFGPLRRDYSSQGSHSPSILNGSSLETTKLLANACWARARPQGGGG